MGTYATEVEQGPFAVPLEERLALLAGCCEAMQQRPSVRVAQAHMSLFREKKWFVSSEGSKLEQLIVENGGRIMATAVGDDGIFQRRSFENHAQGGYEFLLSLDLPAQAERCAAEAEALLSAPVCPSGPRTVILGSSILALQVHESCGHPVELDRALGSEASYAGTSFMTVDQLGLLQYGSPVVNITADATLPGGLGTFGWDDEGTPAEAFPVIREGRFVNYLTSRETAWWLAHNHAPTCPVPPLPFSNGTMRADGWGHLPLIRMTNISLEPGERTWDELLADSDGALFLDTPKSWSLDDKRLNFHFGTEVAYEIEGGRLGRMLRDASYTDRTPVVGSALAKSGPALAAVVVCSRDSKSVQCRSLCASYATLLECRLTGDPNLPSLNDFAAPRKGQPVRRLRVEREALVARQVLVARAKESARRLHHERLLLPAEDV